MMPSQRSALARIVRRYRENESKRYSIRFKFEPPLGRNIYCRVFTRWDGEKNTVGSLMESSGMFRIGPKGKITVISAFCGYKEQVTHMAYLLDADVGYGSAKVKNPPREYNRAGSRSKTRRVWAIADANKGMSRKEILALASAEGINPNTAATQYAAWLNHAKFLGRV